MFAAFSRVTCGVACALLVSLSAIPAAWAAQCKLGKLAEFPITMENLRPLMTAKINGADARFIVDSGAWFSMISAASAEEFHLSTYPAPFGLYMTGVGGGTADVSVTRVKVFTIAGVDVKGVEFLVGGSEVGSDSIGLLGQNVLHLADVEYDLAQGAVRLMRAVDCDRRTSLAYWAIAASTPYSIMSIEPSDRRSPHTLGTAYLNGSELRVMFDTGAGTSILSLKAAARVGIRPDSPGVVFEGNTHGIGRNTLPTYLAPFSSFKIGDEEIKNTQLRMGDIDLPNADMLIGADFFLSHRIYVANGQRRLYFSYNGGPVFKLTGPKPTKVPPDPAAAEPAPSAPAETAKQPEIESSDAADLSRRGAALASRRDFEGALADLTRACELAPDHFEYFYQRGMIHWNLRHAAEAMSDFNQVLKLHPNDVPTLMARAELRMKGGDQSQAIADVDAATLVAAKEADTRLTMGELYEAGNREEDAIAQYDLWIAAHPDDVRLPHAFNSRCWARAVRGIDLPLALKDCNAALKRAEKTSGFYARTVDSRGLVYLKMGDYEKATADFDLALKIRPSQFSSLYGRGIAELRAHKTSAGEADLAQAAEKSPNIAKEYERRGITP